MRDTHTHAHMHTHTHTQTHKQTSKQTSTRNRQNSQTLAQTHIETESSSPTGHTHHITPQISTHHNSPRSRLDTWCFDSASLSGDVQTWPMQMQTRLRFTFACVWVSGIAGSASGVVAWCWIGVCVKGAHPKAVGGFVKECGVGDGESERQWMRDGRMLQVLMAVVWWWVVW